MGILVVFFAALRSGDVGSIFTMSLFVYFGYCFFSIYSGLSIKGYWNIKPSLVPTLINQLLNLVYISLLGLDFYVLGQPGLYIGINTIIEDIFFKFAVAGYGYAMTAHPQGMILGINLFALTNILLMWHFFFRKDAEQESTS